MPTPLVPWRRTAIVTVVVASLGVLAGGIAFHDDHYFNHADWNLLTWTNDHFGASFLRQLLHITTPWAVTALIVMVVAGALLARNRRLGVVAAAGPLLAFVLTEHVLKPLVGRTIPRYPRLAFPTHTLAYPSGHETGLASLTTVLVILVFVVTASKARRVAAIVVALVVDLLGCLALVGNYFHYATDTFAAIGVAVGSVVGVALLVDARTVASSPDAATPASTARAA
jgi:hypothetical protein